MLVTAHFDTDVDAASSVFARVLLDTFLTAGLPCNSRLACFQRVRGDFKEMDGIYGFLHSPRARLMSKLRLRNLELSEKLRN